MVIANKSTTCKASASRGYSFDLWSGLVSSEENPLKFTPKDYGTVTANFQPTLSFDQYIFLIGGVTGSLRSFGLW